MKNTGTMLAGRRTILVEPELNGRTLTIRVEVSRDLRRYFRKSEFFIRYEQDVSADEGVLGVPAVGLLLPLAWLTGSRLQIRRLDRAFAAATEALQVEFGRMYPKLEFRTELVVDELTDSPPNPEGTAMLFSGGLDAVYSFYANRQLKPRLVEVFGTEFPLANEPYLQQVRQDSTLFAEKHGVPLSFIHTNIPFLFDQRAVIHRFAGIRGKVGGDLWKGMGYAIGYLSMAAPLSAGRFDHLIIAAWADRETARNAVQNPDASSPVTDEAVAWSNLRVEHHGCLHRHEKVQEMKDWLPGNPVRVCWYFETAQALGESVNCCRCEKCGRTIVALAVAGVDPRMCGFTINDETVRCIRDRLEKGIMKKSQLAKWWVPMQKQVPEHLEGDQFGLREFLEWFRTFDLGAGKDTPGFFRMMQDAYYRLPFPLAVFFRSTVYGVLGEPYWLNRPESECGAGSGKQTLAHRSVIRRAAEILKKEGLRSLWFKILGETIYRRVNVFEKPLDSPARAETDPEHIEIERLKAEQVDEFVAFRSYAPREIVLGRLAQGQACHIVRSEGKMVHCSWSATGEVSIDYLGCKCRLDPDVIYIYESYTAPEFRGKSVSAVRSGVVHQWYREQGYRRYLSVSWPENRSARRSIIKSGARISGRMGYWGFGAWKRYFIKSQSTRLPLQIMEKNTNQPTGHGENYWNEVPGGLDNDNHYLDPFLAQLKRRENLRLVKEWGELGPESRILKTDAFEEAMGADSFLADLKMEGREVTGMDLSSEIAKRASENHTASGIGFLAADVRQLPMADASFSVVVSPSTLDHFPDASDLGVSLLELFRIMKPGGRLVITLDNRQNLFDPLLKLVHRLGWVPYFIGQSYTVSELRDELEQAGFEVRETTAILHNPRLVAVATMKLVRWLRWRPLIRLTEKLMDKAQRLENTFLCYYTGSFVAALAVRPERSPNSSSP